MKHRTVARPFTGAAVLVALVLLLSAGPAAGGIAPEPEEAVKPAMDLPGSSKAKGDRKFDYVIAPIPTVNPLLGAGVTVPLGLLYRVDPADNVSPSSVTGVAGFYTENGSWGAAGGQKLYLFEDRLRLLAGAGYASLKYEYTFKVERLDLPPLPASLQQDVTILGVEALVRTWGKLYAGPYYRYVPSTIYGDGPIRDYLDPYGIPRGGLELTLGTLGLHVQHDLRNDTTYPTDGGLLELKASFQDGAFGSDRTYQKYTGSYDRFISFSPRSVLAVRGMACRAEGEGVPFFDQCLVGAGSDIRGYTVGAYQDRTMVAAQAELRQEVWKRLGVVVFAGVADVAREFGDLGSAEKLPGYGAGLRFTLSKDYRVNFRADVARGKDDTNWYVGIGEAF